MLFSGSKAFSGVVVVLLSKLATFLPNLVECGKKIDKNASVSRILRWWQLDSDYNAFSGDPIWLRAPF